MLVYDTSTNTWSTRGNWSNAMSDSQATTVYDSSTQTYNIYVVGGYDQIYNSLNVIWHYDFPSNTFTAKAPMHVPRGDVGVATLGGYVYCFGGYNSYAEPSFCHPTNTLERFDPTANNGYGKWTILANMSSARADMAYATLNGRLYVIAGEAKDEHCFVKPIRNVEAYDPALDKWVPVINVTERRFRFLGASYIDGIYCVGGQGFYDAVDHTYPILNDVSEYREVEIVSPGVISVVMYPWLVLLLSTCALLLTL